MCCLYYRLVHYVFLVPAISTLRVWEDLDISICLCCMVHLSLARADNTAIFKLGMAWNVLSMQSDTTTSIILGGNSEILHSEEWVLLWASIVTARPKRQLMIISSRLRSLMWFSVHQRHGEALAAIRLMLLDSQRGDSCSVFTDRKRPPNGTFLCTYGFISKRTLIQTHQRLPLYFPFVFEHEMFSRAQNGPT